MFLKILIVLCIISFINCDGTIEITCTTHNDCKSFADKFISSECISSECSCVDRKTGNSVDCTPKLAKSNNQLKSEMCLAPNTEYKNGTCRTSTVHLGKACETSEQCVRNDLNSGCFNGICACKEHFMEIDNVCRSLIKIEKCTQNDQCNENAECLKEKCVCNKEYISSSNFTKCLPFSSYNKACFENSQCEMRLGFGSVCENSVCKCKPDFKTVQMNDKYKCLQRILVGDACSDDSDCKNDGDSLMYCEDEKCKCLEGFEPNNEKMCWKYDARTMSLSSAAAAPSFNDFKMYLLVISLIVFALAC